MVSSVHPETRRQLSLIAVEIGIIGFVAGFLVALEYLIPSYIESNLILHLETAEVNPATFFTASYFHVDAQQLWGNVLGYTVGAVFCYVLCLSIDERQWYWLTFLSMLTLVPFLTNWANVSVFAGIIPDVPSRGFSDVASGFAGFLFVSLLALVRNQYSRTMTGYVGMFVVVVMMGELLLIYAESPSTESIGLIIFALLLLLSGIAWNGRIRSKEESLNWLNIIGIGVVVSLTIVVIMWEIQAMFPSDIIVDGQFKNIFAHATGFGLGIVISGWGHRYWAKQDW